jgi:hypothetical protein
MDTEVRLAALSKLVAIDSIETDRLISREFDTVVRTLSIGTRYEELSDALRTLGVLAPKFHGALIPLLRTLWQMLQSKGLTHDDTPFAQSLASYQTVSLLVREAIEVARRIGYVRTAEVFGFFLELSAHDDAEVRTAADNALESLAQFDFHVFSGEHGQGAAPQGSIVEYLSKLDESELVARCSPILRVLEAVLSPSIQGTSWTHDQLTIRRGGVSAAHGVSDVRSAAIRLLKRMYFLSDTIGYRKGVLNTLDGATRCERRPDDRPTEEMFERDAAIVLAFLRDLVHTEALPLVQAIEHDAYWDYFHAASATIESAALEVRDAIAQHSEYQIYKLLIGFEGIFGKWEDLKRSESAWDYSDAHRREAARRFVLEIDEANRAQWRDRILEFSKTQSNDLATFPVFYAFLEIVGREKPDFAMELLTRHETAMAPFLIPMIRGLYKSTHADQVGLLVDGWIGEGKYLAAIAKSQDKSHGSPLSLLDRVLERAAQIPDTDAIVNVMGVSTTLHGAGSNAKPLFVKALRVLSATDDVGAVVGIWYSRELRNIIEEFDSDERAELLTALMTLPQLNYQAEEILFHVAKSEPEGVLKYLLSRVAKERTQRHDSNTESYEAVPYRFHKLSDVLASQPAALVAGLRSEFDAEKQGLFAYRGARLAKSVFPSFEPQLQSELLKMLTGSDARDIAFVVAILQSYGGCPAILEIVREIVKVAQERSETWSGLAATIENTGAVWGAYGIAEAFERKKAALEPWKEDENARVRAFAEWLTVSLDRMIISERVRVDEETALRKYKYGNGADGN